METNEKHFDNAKDLVLYVAGYMWQKMKAYVDGVVPKANYSKTSYTSFSGGVISSGTINVVKNWGECHVFGEIKLTGNISDWTEVLDAAKVPAPKHGTNKYVSSTTWGTSFVRAPRIQINGSGGLRLRYGAAATYNFDTTYPI